MVRCIELNRCLCYSVPRDGDLTNWSAVGVRAASGTSSKKADFIMKLTQTTYRLLPAALMLLLLSATLAQGHEPTPAASAAATSSQQQPASPAASAPSSQHDMSNMPMKSGDNSLIGHLKNPDYMHTLLNPLPVYGLSMGVLALCIGLLFRNRTATVAALVLIFVSGFAAWPVYYFGEEAYDRVKAMSDPIGAQWLDEHMARAEKLIYIFYVLAGGALAGILAPLKWPRTAFPLAVGVLVLGALNLGLGGWISYAGGHVRHPEFRFEPPPMAKSDGHTHTHGKDEGEMDHGDKKAENEQAKPMDHGNMPGMEPGKSPAAKEQPMQHDMAMTPAPPTQEQLEASRLQLEASRLQLEASRKQLEAAEAAKGQTASPAPPQAKPSPTPDGHEHKH